MSTTTTVYIDHRTDLLVVREPGRAVLELSTGGERVRIIAPGGFELGRMAAFTLDEVCDPRVLGDNGDAA